MSVDGLALLCIRPSTKGVTNFRIPYIHTYIYIYIYIRDPGGYGSHLPITKHHHTRTNGASNHQQLDCLFNSLFKLAAKRTKDQNSALMALCEGNSLVVSHHKDQLCGKCVRFMTLCKEGNKHDSWCGRLYVETFYCSEIQNDNIAI